MSTSSPVRTRQPRRPSRPPEAESNRSPRADAVATVVRSSLLVVAAVSVIATSNYFAYLIGRKQVTYEELRRQVDLVVQLVNKKRAENELASAPPKPRQDRLEQNAPDHTGLTTSTINGKTTAVAPEPAGKTIPAALLDDTGVVPADHEVRAPPPESSLKTAAKPGVAQRGSRRQKVAPASAASGRGAAAGAFAEQPAQLTTAPSATPDRGVGGQ